MDFGFTDDAEPTGRFQVRVLRDHYAVGLAFDSPDRATNQTGYALWRDRLPGQLLARPLIAPDTGSNLYLMERVPRLPGEPEPETGARVGKVLKDWIDACERVDEISEF